MTRILCFTSLLFVISSGQAQTLLIPQIADGGGWQTTLVLTNTTTTATSASLSFFQDTAGGATQSWTPSLLEAGSLQNLALPGGATVFLHTSGTASVLTVGWAQLQAGAGVAAYAIFTARTVGRPDQDGTATATPAVSRILVPFDNTNGLVTSLAIANPAGASESISVGIQPSSGASSLAAPITLPAQGHLAFGLPQQFPATAGKSGLAEFYSATGSFSILALRFNSTGAFTTAPVFPETGPPIITSSGPSGTPRFSSIVINSSALGISNLLVVFPAANGTYFSGSVQGTLTKANGGVNGIYSATWSSVTVDGQTLTFTGLQTTASTMQNNNGNTVGITSGTLTITLAPQDSTSGAVTGTMTLTSTLATVSGSFSGTYSAQPSAADSPTSVTFYVAPGGNDAWSGQLPVPNSANTNGPFATLDHARAVVQAISKAGANQVNVQFRAGTYSLSATEMFSAADSGSATTKVVYQNYPGESPVFSGGVRVQNWTNTGGNDWKTTLPASTQYFENLFYNGIRRLRPRLGGTALGVFYRFAGPVYLGSAVAPPPPAAAPNANCAVYITGSGWECFDRFQYNPSDPIVNTWKNLAPPPGNPCNQPAGNPALTGDIELLDFEQFTTSKLRISCVDAANHIVYTTGPTGFSQSNSSQVGFIANDRYLVENVQDQLTQPGQWFLDRSTTPWTLTYLANSGENPNNDSVIIPQIPQLLIASNLQYVTFQGLTFEHDNYTLPPEGHSSKELEPEVSAALSFQNSQHITFDAGTVTQISGTGLEIISCLGGGESPDYCVSNNANAVTANDVVENSAFYDIGALGVRIGEPRLPVNTDANSPQSITVVNNVVEGYGRTIPASFGIGQGEGHDNLYTHNDVYDGYHCAVSISEATGDTVKPTGNGDFNNVISFNHVYNLLQGIMNDGGSIRIESGNSVFNASGNKILNNKIHDVTDASIMDNNGYGGNGIYLDNQTGQVDVENNLVYRVSGNAVYTPHGPAAPNEANIIKNNILAFGRLSMVTDNFPYSNGVPATAAQAFVITNNIFYFDRSSASSPKFYVQGGCTYSAGFPYTQYQQWNGNLYWRTDGGFAGDTKAFDVQPGPGTGPNPPCAANMNQNTFFTFSGWQQSVGEDTNSIVRNPGFNNPAYPADDYSLPNGSPGVGFVVFDPSLAGRTNPVIHPPAIFATFPTKLFNPATDY